ncbi:MAG TPA: hypothetical protein VFS83_01375 [Ktedonobacterales bacterium]|nr:hypothetical protein [Ktedonobacterales bacterium]
MTTCPRCGQPLQTPVPACPRCGQRFAPPPQQYQANGYDGAAAAWGYQAPPQQPQPPQQQPPSPGAGMYGQPAARPGFSVHDLVSEEALPDWLRQASAESAQPTQRQPVPGAPGSPASTYAPQQPYPSAYPPANQSPAPGYGGYGGNGNGYGGYPPAPASAEEPPVQRPDASAFPSLESAGSYQAPLVGGGGMPASSLLDPNALPTWLGGQQGQAAPDGMRGGEGMRAQSLVDEAALPGWMRNEPASPAQAPVAAPPPAAPGWGGYPAPSVSPAAPAGYAGMPMPMQQQMQPMQSPAAPVQMNGQPGFSANQLIDPGALPEWMRNQGQAGTPQPGGMPQSPGAAAPAPVQPGWSASDLIDPSMLPGFVRGNEAPMPAPPPENNLARERTSRVPAPPIANPADERDFGASRAGTAHRGGASRKHQAARPLGENEKPGWLREESQGGYGQDDSAAYPSARQSRADNGRNGNGYNGNGDRDGYNAGYDGYNDPNAYEDYGAQNGRNGYRGQPAQRGRMPEGQTGRSRAARDARDGYGYETSRRGRQQPTRQQPAQAPKKRKGGLFGFFKRG